MNTHPHEFEIAIVGAGPAGLMAAIAAARAGRRVLLLDRRTTPGVPVRCGEGIGLKGMSVGMSVRPEWIRTTIRKASLVSPGGHEVRLTDIPESYILDRVRMEQDLFDTAIAEGATGLLATPVHAVERQPDSRYLIRTPEASYTASCVIVADGVESRIGRDLGWNTALADIDTETCAFAKVHGVPLDDSSISLYLGSKVAPGGYAWIFPLSEDSANVGLGILGTKSAPGKARELLDRFLQTRFPGAVTDDYHCGGVPVGRSVLPLVRGGALLVGDAARQVNAVNGAGLAYAAIAGRSAGETAAKAFVSGRFDSSLLSTYESDWKQNYGKQQARSYAIKRMIIGFSDTDMDRIAARLIRKKGKLSYLGVFLTTFSRRPLLMLKAFHLFR